ncbi:MAG: aldehyde dehydrogenase [Flavobacteriaceae bacterium]|nr:aldehyde dehydrogenase [Flavobacteriaceae bacterium]
MKNSTPAFINNIKEKQLIFFKDFKTQDVKIRIKHLKKLKRVLEEREESLFEALYKDLKKPVFESFTSELLMVQKELDLHIKNIKEWAAPKRVSGSLINFPSQDYILSEPYGTVLIISPWNYPFQLAMIPLIGAIAAGNTAVIKPSESAPHTAQIIEEIISEVFPPEWVIVIQGGVKVGAALLKTQWDYIFYTGSTAVGKIVAKAAAEFLTPTTLELGGKSPCIVDGTASIQKTARRIVWGKFLNCGQTCIAPDYVLVQKEYKNALVAAMIQEIEKAFGKNAKNSKDYGRIIHQKHFEKLEKDLDKQKLLFGGENDKDELYFGPTLVEEPALDSSLLVDEIFGPILPVLSYTTESDIDSVLTKLKNPLAFYLFSTNRSFINTMIQRYSFGGGVVNDAIIHFTNDKLPFGGIGNSGMGAYHGKHSFEVFTHAKPVVKRSFWFDLPQRYAPYPKSLKALKFLLKKI